MSEHKGGGVMKTVAAGEVASGAPRCRWRQPSVASGALLLLLSLSQGAQTQTDTSRHAWIFRTPSFVLQPGAVTSNVFDRPAGTSASTAFNLRVVTAIPTT